MAPPDTDPSLLRSLDSLAILPDDPHAAAEEIQRRRDELGLSYFVFGAEVSDSLASVVSDWLEPEAADVSTPECRRISTPTKMAIATAHSRQNSRRAICAP